MKDGVTFFRAGQKKGKVSGLIDEEKMNSLLEKLRKEYDVILMDAAPSYVFSDAMILSSYADKVLYVVRVDKADAKEIRADIFLRADMAMEDMVNIRNTENMQNWMKKR